MKMHIMAHFWPILQACWQFSARLAIAFVPRRSQSCWQVRYKLFDRKWHSVTNRQRRLDWAKRMAGAMYDRTRLREEEGLPQKPKRFDAIARECIKTLDMEIERGIRRETNKDYIRTINK
ncbi:MAG: hypothetical protein ACOYB1_08395 [Limnohabitans sp.]